MNPTTIQSSASFAPMRRSISLQRFLPWIVLGVALIGTFISWRMEIKASRAKARMGFDACAAAIKSQILGGLQDDEQILLGARGLFAVQGDVSRDEWRRYVSSLQLGQNFPGILGVGYSVWLPASEKEAHTASIRKQGFPDYAIRPAGERPFYTSIIYLEPFDWRNQRAFGYDIYTEPVRRFALDKAKDGGQATLTGRIILVQETEKDRQNGVLMMVPVYKMGMAVDTVENRRAAFKGIVYSPIRIGDLIHSTVKFLPPGIGFRVSENSGNDSESTLFHSLEGQSSAESAMDGCLFEKTEQVNLFGQTWRFSFFTLPQFNDAFSEGKTNLILFGGIALSILLYLIVRAQVTAQSRAVLLAETMVSKLKTAEAQKQLILDHNPMGISYVSNRRIQWANPAHDSIFGYSVGETLGMEKALLYCSLEDYEKVEKEADAKMAEGGVYSVEVEMKRKDGSRCWCALVGSAVNPAHLFEGSIWMCLDISERIRAQEEARFSNARYRALFENMLSGYVYCKMVHKNGEPIDFVYLEVNSAFERLTGLKNITGKKVSELFPDAWQSTPEHFKIYERVMETGKPEKLERLIKTPLCGWVAMDVYRPEPGHFAVIFDDITERKQAEAALRESEHRFATMFKASPAAAGISRLDNGHFIDVNDAFVKLFGYSREEVLGSTSMELGLWPMPSEREMLLKTLDGPAHVEQMEAQFRRKSGEVGILLISAEVIQLNGQGHLFGLLLDISERKRLEEQLLQAQKMETIGHLAGGMAHEFNNILAAMMLNIALCKPLASEPELANLLSQCEALSKRAAHIVKQLLAFSRKSAMRLEPMNLANAVSSQRDLFQRLLGERVIIDCVFPPRLPWVKADRTLIEQAVLNLCINARDAMNGSGQLRLILSEEQIDVGHGAQIENFVPGIYVCLTIEDNGCGMDGNTLNRIFEPFFTTKGTGQGTGLGLAMVHGIIKQHGGWVQVASQVGKGSTFKVYLPAIAGQAHQLPLKSVPKVNTGNELVFLVEDERSLRVSTALFLKKQGYRVLEASSIAEAGRLWNENLSEIAILLTDMVLPDVETGLVFAKRLRHVRPSLPVIIISGYSEDLFGSPRLVEPDLVFLSKPCDPFTLVDTIRDLLDRNPMEKKSPVAPEDQV